MAYDVELADRVRDVLDTLDTGGVVEKRMFGGLAFLVGGHMAVAASGQDGGLLLRCPPEETDALVATDPGRTGRFVMRGKEMTGWLRIDADAVADGESLRRWVSVGVDYAGALPPKE